MAKHPYIGMERAMNTSTSTGTGNMVLGAVVDGYVTLDQAPMDADPFPYCIEGIDGACAGEVEIGIGTVITGELARVSAQYHIAAGEFTSGAQTFSAGTKRIYLRVIPPASTSGQVSLIGAAQSLADTRGFQRCQATAFTANATPAVMDGSWCFDPNEELSEGATFPMDVATANTLRVFRLTISARSASDYKAWALDYAVEYPSATNAALVGSPAPVVIGATAGAAAWDVDPGASGDLSTLTVTGAAATDITWSADGTVSLA